ncbi:MAG: extracellular solute-binding protein [Clostridia bacterium]|nr:extracellular solute-binding protein [Clostridia bacterium]
MKKMVKVVALIAVLALSASLFAGCGAGGSDKNENGQTVISVGSWPTKESKALTDIEARKARFEEANPDVVIEPDTWGFDRKTFYAKAAGGQLPTIFNTAFTEVPEIISSEYSADLAKIMKKRGYDGKLNPNILEMVSDGDKILAFPTNSYILGIAFNAELFEKAGLLEADGTPKQPKDWNEMVEMAVTIKEKTGKAGLVLPTANRSGGWIFTSIAWSFGVDFMEKDADGKWKATFNTPEAAEALQFYKDLKWKYDVLPTNTLIDSNEWYKTYGVGAAGMTVTAGDYPGKVVKFGMTPDQVGMMAIPAGPKRHVTLLGGDVQAVKAGSTDDQIDAAIRWIETAYTSDLTDEYKKNMEDRITKNLSDNQHVGIQAMSPWSEESEALNWYRKLVEDNTNSNINHVRLYNECVMNCPFEIQAEEPVSCQELYAILDGCLQEVLSNKDADVVALLEKANNDFQVNYLDNMNL